MTYIPSTTDNGWWTYPTYPLPDSASVGGTTITWTPEPDPEPVRVMLPLDEVDTLRTAARENPALRAVLNRLAECIDVDVDFGDDDADAAGVKTGA